MPNLLFTIVVCCLGCFIGYMLAKRQPTNHSRADSGNDEEGRKSEKDVQLMVSSLYELTSHVDLKVGHHTDCVSEITDTLEPPNKVSSSVIGVAGKMLVSANKKLQHDLVEARQEIQRQRDAMAACMTESQTDALTSIANRRGLDHELVRAFAIRRRTGMTFSMLFIDIDHFKRVNDKHGHMVGDQLLKSLSRRLVSTFRESDFVARFGGEEFVAILPQTTLEEACKAAERIRSIISSTTHSIGDLEICVTTSIGIKEVQLGETESELIQRADKALYAAKNGGRDCSYYHDGVMCHRYIPEVEEQPADSSDELVASESSPAPLSVS